MQPTSETTAEAIEPEEGFIDTPGGRIHFLDFGGSGIQAHFLHANGFCAGTYTPFIKMLADELRVVASDVRGHGGSVLLNSQRIRHWRVFAEDVRRLVQRRMSPPIIGIGHSLGAVCTYIAAALYPGLFSRIVLIDPPILDGYVLATTALLKMLGLKGNIPLARSARRRKKTFNGKQEALQRFTSGKGIFKSWSTDFVEAYLECGLLEKDSGTAVLRCDPELEAQIFESIPLNVWSYARRITCPVLVIRGEHSDVLTDAAARRLRRVITDCRQKTLPDCGHFIPMENPGACAGEILQFLHGSVHPG
jgi:pimeloyl-ACP methyl ester carboxylesterase